MMLIIGRYMNACELLQSKHFPSGPFSFELILFFISAYGSMGGSVAVHVAAKKVLPSLSGLIVVDVVEVVPLVTHF